jgi:hypothetical protein
LFVKKDERRILLRSLSKCIGRTHVLEEILAPHEVQVLEYGLETKHQNSAMENSRYCGPT